MTFNLGWNKKDEEGKRINIEFSLVRDKITWKVRRVRYETREEFHPEEEDWETLFETMDRHLARGKVSHTDYKLVKRLHRER